MNIRRNLSFFLLLVPFVLAFTSSQNLHLRGDHVDSKDESNNNNFLVPGDNSKSAVYKNCRISFIHTNADGDFIYVMNQDGTGKIKLADKANIYAWSPDGSKIAYVASNEDKYQIKTVSAIGKNTLTLTPFLSEEIIGLMWSPDGKTLIFGNN
jgi:Tol biopolymer transport system component